MTAPRAVEVSYKNGSQWLAELYRDSNETPIVSLRGWYIYKQNDGFIGINFSDFGLQTKDDDVAVYDDSLDVLVERILQRLGI